MDQLGCAQQAPDPFGVGFWSLDLETMEPYWSTRVFDILGLREPSFRAFLDGIHPDDRPLVDHVIVRAREQPGPYRVVHRYTRGTELRSLGHHMQAIPGADGRPTRVLGVVADVTDLRAVQEAVAASVTDRNAGLVAGSLVHSFKNQLAIIAGHAQLAIDAVDAGRMPMREGLAAIQRAAVKGAELTRQVMAVGRPSTTVRHRFDPRPLLERVGSLARPIVGAANEVQVEISADAPAVLADAERLEQVLIDLVLNAADALPPSGGRLVLRYRDLAIGSGGPPARDLAPGRYGVFTVADNGAGMDEATLRRATEPFFTTKGADDGTGIGLATAASFGAELGGRLEISSEPGRGTTVELVLPAAPPLPEPAAAPRPIRVVLLADDTRASDAVARGLREAGLQPVSAGSWLEVDRFVRTEPIDAVVVDRASSTGRSAVGAVPVVEAALAGADSEAVLRVLQAEVPSVRARRALGGSG